MNALAEGEAVELTGTTQLLGDPLRAPLTGEACVVPGPSRRGPCDHRVRHVEDTVRVRCPYCREWIDFYVDPDTRGVLIEDCAVCCRPWTVTIERDGDRLRVQVARAQ